MDSTMADWGMSENSAPAASAQEELHACDTVQEFRIKLQQLFDNATSSLIPDFFTVQLAIGSRATFDIAEESQLDAEPARSDVANHPSTTVNDTLPKKRRKLEKSLIDTTYRTVSVMEVLNDQPEKKPIPIQRAVAKIILTLITEIDGFGWQMQNTTRAKDGWRLEYVCSDSYQNKARAGNKMRREEASDDIKEHRQALPTFDCKGRVLCVFSIKQESIIVRYSHNPVHRTVASRKQRQTRSCVEKKPDVVAISPPQTIADDGAQLGDENVHEPNPLRAPKHGHGYGYPSLTQNPLNHPSSDAGSGIAGSSARHSSPYSSPYRTITPNPLRNPNTMSMVTVLQQHQRSASVDFSIKRSKAFSLLAAAGIDVGTLSEYQLQVFQDQDLTSQKTSLKLFDEYGPSQLMVVARDMPGFDDPLNAYEIPSSRQNSLQPSSHPLIPQSAGLSSAVISNIRSGREPDRSRPTGFSSIHLQNPHTSSNGSRRSSLVSDMEAGSSEDRYGVHSNTRGEVPSYANGYSAGSFGEEDMDASTKDRIVTTELTANGTPKQPGVFEFDSKKIKEVKTAKASAGAGRGKYPRKPAVTYEKTKWASRTGCKTCGKRRMKCDEGHPVCNNCLKAGKDCNYGSPPSSMSSSPAPRNAWDRAKEASQQASSPPANLPFQETMGTPADENDAWLLDLIAASQGIYGT